MYSMIKQVSKIGHKADRGHGEVFNEEFAADPLSDSYLCPMAQNSGGQVRGLAEQSRALPPTVVGHEPA